MKIYRGAARGARAYLDADHYRADDYYLTEGSGLACRYAAGAEHQVRELAPLTGDAYEAWVTGLDPETREPRGRLRQDANAVRFVEVVVNGPKSWSLAAELHPDVAAAYEGAQDRAAGEVIGWLAKHVTTRIGPRGQQVAVPVERLEAAVVRHYTSRAGDPHRHLHLQVNARVFAARRWRGWTPCPCGRRSRRSTASATRRSHATRGSGPHSQGTATRPTLVGKLCSSRRTSGRSPDGRRRLSAI
jgi:hypothetical protein